jgi:hypothetical protein
MGEFRSHSMISRSDLSKKGRRNVAINRVPATCQTHRLFLTSSFLFFSSGDKNIHQRIVEIRQSSQTGKLFVWFIRYLTQPCLSSRADGPTHQTSASPGRRSTRTGKQEQTKRQFPRSCPGRSAGGHNCRREQHMLAKNQPSVPSRPHFSQLQQTLIPVFDFEARQACSRVRCGMTDDSYVSVDSSWSFGRHADRCFVSLAAAERNLCCGFHRRHRIFPRPSWCLRKAVSEPDGVAVNFRRDWHGPVEQRLVIGSMAGLWDV